jgi:hypothetical protein
MDAIHPVDTLTLCGLLLLKPFTLAAGTVHASAQMLGTAKETEKTRFDASRDTPHISHQTLSTAHFHELIQALFCSVLEFGPVPRPDIRPPLCGTHLLIKPVQAPARARKSERHNSIEQQPAHAKYVTK